MVGGELFAGLGRAPPLAWPGCFPFPAHTPLIVHVLTPAANREWTVKICHGESRVGQLVSDPAEGKPPRLIPAGGLASLDPSRPGVRRNGLSSRAEWGRRGVVGPVGHFATHQIELGPLFFNMGTRLLASTPACC